jgi:hypothetical protein
MWSSHSSLTRGGRGAADEAVLAASAHLTGRDRRLVRLVAEHRVLTTGQLCALGFDSPVTARHRLALLERLRVLRRFRPHREVGSAPWHYLLGLVGAAVLGAEDGDERRWLGQVRADRQLALVRSQRLAHLTGVNWVFAALARHARTHGGELRCWLGEQAAADHMSRLTHYPTLLEALPHPDGLGIWADDGAEVVFALEYDTGSEHLPQLAAKLASYGELAARVHATAVMPALLFCFGAPRREQSARRALAASPEAARLQIATAAFDPALVSPAGPVWLPLAGGQERVRLIELAAILPGAGRGWPDHLDGGQPSAAGELEDPEGLEDPDDPYGP